MKKIVQNKLKKVLSLVLIWTMLISIASFATESIETYAADRRSEIELSLYNAEYYAKANEDVAVALNYDETAMYQHWLNYGKAEGRNASMVFNAKYYLEVNPDVAAVLGEKNYEGAYEHFVNSGLLEGRESSPVFSVKYYLQANTDVANAFNNDYVMAAQHFNLSAIAEGRSGSGNFDYTVYRDCNKDVEALYGDYVQGYYIHYINHGRAEGRTGGLGVSSDGNIGGGNFIIDETAASWRIFDASFYLERYPELKSTVGTDAAVLYKYWMTEGISKGQTASPVIVPEEYLELNKDVADAFGDDYAAVINHFLNAGINEGRTGSKEFDYSIYADCNTDVGGVFADDIVGYYFHYVKYGKAEKRTAAPYIPEADTNKEEPYVFLTGDYITTKDITLDFEDFVYEIDENVYVPGYLEMLTRSVWSTMEKVSELTFEGNKATQEMFADKRIRIEITKDNLYADYDWYTGLKSNEFGSAYAGGYEASMAPGDLLLGNSNTLIHELSHVLMFRQSRWFHSQLLNEGFAEYTTYLTLLDLENNSQEDAFYLDRSIHSLWNMTISDYEELYKQPIEYWFENRFEYSGNANYSIGFRFMWYLQDVYGDYSSWISEFEKTYPYSEYYYISSESTVEQQVTVLKKLYGEDVLDNFYPWLKAHQEEFEYDYDFVTDRSNMEKINIYPEYNAIDETLSLEYLEYNDLYVNLESARKYLVEYKKADASNLWLTTDEPIIVNLYQADGSYVQVVTDKQVSLENISYIKLIGNGQIKSLKITGFYGTSIQTPTQKPAQNSPVLSFSGSELQHTVNTASEFSTPYSESDDAAGRTPLYFYHPRKLVIENQEEIISFWHSSNTNVVRVYSDGIVEAMSEGIADITAYNSDGNPIQTFLLYTTTSADENILEVTQGDVEEYTKIPFYEIQEKINTIADYAYWLYANDVFYDMNEEASNPASYTWSGGQWMQMANADWIFKNLSGICCSVAAGGMYALVGDYEENGLIYMSGPYGHVISYYKENGQYYVVDFTRNISDRKRGVDERYDGDVLAYMEAGIGTGATLMDAFENYLEYVGSNFYMENYIIYAVNLTGLDYYPAEANNWCYGKDFYDGPNRLYVSEGTQVEEIYIAENVDFEVVEMPRNNIPGNMEIVLESTDVMSTETSMLLLEVPKLETFSRLTGQTFNTDALQNTLAPMKQKDLLQIINLSSDRDSSFSTTITDREPVYLFHPKQLTLNDNTSKVAFWYSSNPNSIRVSSDGKVIAYSEGFADVLACGVDGSIIEKFSLYATTCADAIPLEATVGDGSAEAYENMYYEDIKETLNTITDYASWMYANNLGYDGYREPMSPDTGWVNHSGTMLEWMQMANSNWVFKDYSGICCNAAAGAMYALEGDYEQYGLIFMSGPYGHVLNYYMEDGCYYVVDFTAVMGGYDITNFYNGSPEAYIKANCGTGATLKEAFEDYINKGNGSFYYENYMIYAMNFTGLDYYPAECNNWHSDSHTEIFVRTNILYVPEGTMYEILYVDERIKFEIEEISSEKIPAKMEKILVDRLTR